MRQHVSPADALHEAFWPERIVYLWSLLRTCCRRGLPARHGTRASNTRWSPTRRLAALDNHRGRTGSLSRRAAGGWTGSVHAQSLRASAQGVVSMGGTQRVPPPLAYLGWKRPLSVRNTHSERAD